jgi:hypothetical protein
MHIKKEIDTISATLNDVKISIILYNKKLIKNVVYKIIIKSTHTNNLVEYVSICVCDRRFIL